MFQYYISFICFGLWDILAISFFFFLSYSIRSKIEVSNLQRRHEYINFHRKSHNFLFTFSLMVWWFVNVKNIVLSNTVCFLEKDIERVIWSLIAWIRQNEKKQWLCCVKQNWLCQYYLRFAIKENTDKH